MKAIANVQKQHIMEETGLTIRVFNEVLKLLGREYLAGCTWKQAWKQLLKSIGEIRYEYSFNAWCAKEIANRVLEIEKMNEW